jgi:mRNA-degrading endonuclease RelE of RelBE toxin-antitoxin system
MICYQVQIRKKVERGLRKLPSDVQKLFFLLVAELQSDGPVQKSWRNFSSLGKDRYNCFLNYRYLAYWTCRNNEIEIKV